jgi:hypothetical protein
MVCVPGKSSGASMQGLLPGRDAELRTDVIFAHPLSLRSTAG